MSKPTIFIHTNNQQLVGALVSAYSMKRTSKSPDAFDVKLIRFEETEHLTKRDGQEYTRKGRKAIWHNDDLQSFSPLRMMVPQLMNYRGRAVVTDPDVFAITDIYELLSMDMGGKAVMCRKVPQGYKGNGKSFNASSVMLLDCEKLTHWRWNEDIDNMFSGELDYGPWIGLLNEPPETIGDLGEDWNSFDELHPTTRLLHNTERSTQPWKSGLPIDYDTNIKPAKAKGKAASEERPGIIGRFRSIMGLDQQSASASDEPVGIQYYKHHPDKKQEEFFFNLLKDALEDGVIPEKLIKDRIAENDVRPDAFDILTNMGYVASNGNHKPKLDYEIRSSGGVLVTA